MSEALQSSPALASFCPYISLTPFVRRGHQRPSTDPVQSCHSHPCRPASLPLDTTICDEHTLPLEFLAVTSPLICDGRMLHVHRASEFAEVVVSRVECTDLTVEDRADDRYVCWCLSDLNHPCSSLLFPVVVSPSHWIDHRSFTGRSSDGACPIQAQSTYRTL